MWHLSSESSPCTLRAGKTLPADNRIIKNQAGCEENSLSKQGASRPACRPAVCGRETAFPDRDWIESVLETRQTRPALEHTAPGQSDSRPVAGDCEFIWMIADFVRVIPGCRRSRSSSPAATAGSKPPACRTFRQSKAMRAHRGRRRRSGGFIAGTRSPLAVRGSPLRAIRSVESVSEI
jgi:hypothetical protein